MPRKVEHKEPWTPPSVEEIREVVESLGGKSDTCRLLCKNWNTIDRWCKSGKGIDKANWEYMKKSMSKIEVK